MKKLSNDFYSKMFLVSALWNISASSGSMLLFDLHFKYFVGTDEVMNNFYTSLYGRIFLMFVFFFGVGYYIVSRDVTKNRGIVWMGALAKITLCIIYTYCYMIDRVTLIGFTMINIDFIWAMLYLLFLRQTRDDATIS